MQRTRLDAAVGLDTERRPTGVEQFDHLADGLAHSSGRTLADRSSRRATRAGCVLSTLTDQPVRQVCDGSRVIGVARNSSGVAGRNTPSFSAAVLGLSSCYFGGFGCWRRSSRGAAVLPRQRGCASRRRSDRHAEVRRKLAHVEQRLQPLGFDAVSVSIPNRYDSTSGATGDIPEQPDAAGAPGRQCGPAAAIEMGFR